MFDTEVLNVLKTVGTFIVYKDKLAFMIGPDKFGEKLGIVRIGGHIEEKESYIEALEREIKEESSIKVNLVSTKNTYYKKDWNDGNYCEITDNISWNIRPLLVVGDKTYSTAVFLSYAEEEPKPSSEAYGIIFLAENEIKDICSKKLRLRDFLAKGGKLIQQKEMDYDMEIYAGVHLKFFNDLMQDKKINYPEK